MKVFKNSRKLVLIGIIITIVNGSWLASALAEDTQKAASLKIALLPIVDVFPYYVAEAKGYFDQ